MPEHKIIAFANQKGGVGKTTSAVNIASSLAAKKYSVLLVDCDPQGNATSGLGIRKKSSSGSVILAVFQDSGIKKAACALSGSRQQVVTKYSEKNERKPSPDFFCRNAPASKAPIMRMHLGIWLPYQTYLASLTGPS